MAHIRILPLVAVWVCMTVVGATQPSTISLHPEEKTRPSTSLNKDEPQRAGSLFLGNCMDHFVHGKLASAEQACSQAIQANPREVDAYKLRGYVYLLGHRFNQAAQDFRASLRLRPDDDQEISGYGQSLSGLR